MDLPSAGKSHLCPVTSTQGEKGLSLPSAGHTDPASRDARFSLGLTRTAVMAGTDGRHFPARFYFQATCDHSQKFSRVGPGPTE